MYSRRTSTPVRSSLIALALLLTTAVDAEARPPRHHFEPTDLELDDPGTLEIDLQVGAAHGTGALGNRLFLPDFEVDIGLFQNVELDVDGAFSVNRFDQKTRSFAGDSLWVASKLSLFDLHGPSHPVAFTGGLQLGPRFPTIGARGIGYGLLGLFGIMRQRVHFVGNVGAFVDPGPEITRGQAKSVVAGLDVDLDLDARGIWSLMGEAAVAHYVSADPDQLTTSCGVAFAANASLELSIIGQVGFLPEQDRLAVLLGVSPKFQLWR